MNDEQPDWDRLARETPYSRDAWIAAAQYLGDMDDWLKLWPHVENLARDMPCSPMWAASALRKVWLTPPAPFGTLRRADDAQMSAEGLEFR